MNIRISYIFQNFRFTLIHLKRFVFVITCLFGRLPSSDCDILSRRTLSVDVVVSLSCLSKHDTQWLNLFPQRCRNGLIVRIVIHAPEQCAAEIALSAPVLAPCETEFVATDEQFASQIFLKYVLSRRYKLAEVILFLSSDWNAFSFDRLETILQEKEFARNRTAVRHSSTSWLQLMSSEPTFIRLTEIQPWSITIENVEAEGCPKDEENSERPGKCKLEFDDFCAYLENDLKGLGKYCLVYSANPARDFVTTKIALEAMFARHESALFGHDTEDGDFLIPKSFPWSNGLILSRLWEPLLNNEIRTRLDNSNPHQDVNQTSNEYLLDKHFGPLVTASTAPRLHEHDFRAPTSSLKVYIYDLPSGMHRDMIAALTQHMVDNGVGCGYNIGVCTASGHLSEYSMVFDHGAEVVILLKFLMAADRGAVTTDPAAADIFLVPLMGACAICTHSRGGYKHLYDTTTPHQLLSRLTYFDTPARRRRHVLIKTCESVVNFNAHGAHDILPPAWADFYGEDPEFLMIDLGFKRPGSPRHIIVPPPILHVHVQSSPPPSAEHTSGGEGGGGRDILLFLFAGLRSAGMASSGERNRLVRLVQAVQAQRAGLLPPGARVEVHLVGHSDLSLSESGALMRRAVFCPCPPGDTPVTIRFFQAVVEGCLPVVMEYPSAAGRGRPSWHCAHSAPWADSLPFAARIDYSRFVVAVPAEDTHDPARFAARLTSIGDEEVRARQGYLEDVRGFLMYDWAGRRPDAFSMLLEEIVTNMNSVYDT